MKNSIELHELFSQLDDTERMNLRAADAKRIRRLTEKKLALAGSESTPRSARRRFFLTGLAAALAMVLAACAAAVSAQVWGVQLFDQKQKDRLSGPLYAVSSSVSQPAQGQPERVLAGFSEEILDIDFLNENRIPFFDEVGTVSGSEEKTGMVFPSFVFDNGEVAIFTRADGSGWQLKEADSLTLSLRQNRKENPHASPDGDKLALGVIVDGIPCELLCGYDPEPEYTYTAQSAGEVYFYVQNFSAGPIVVEDTVIRQ